MGLTRSPAFIACVAVLVCGMGVDSAESTLDDCKSALSSLPEKPYSTSLPSMAASSGAYMFDIANKGHDLSGIQLTRGCTIVWGG
jgi:hypothetical protein